MLEPRPDFWIDGRNGELHPIDGALLRAAEEVWPRAFQIVRDTLHDGASAAELLEQVVHEIAESQEEEKLPRELGAPRALLLTRLQQRLINHTLRERRITYVGSIRDLEGSFGARSTKNHDEQRVHQTILIAQVVALFDENARRLMALRLMDYRWAEIARLIGEPAGTLRERFRVALKRLGKRLVTVTRAEGDNQ